MVLNRRAREQMLACCGEIHPDDGLDFRKTSKTRQLNRGENRKAKQLCSQVAETLSLVLSGEMGDEWLRSLTVVSVVPAPDSSRLLVTLRSEVTADEFDRETLEARLAASRGRLRCEVATAVTRRKIPTLAFHVIGPPELEEPS